MSQVFISYARPDAPAAEQLTRALQHAKFSVWWDRQIPPGKTWDEIIGRALDAAACVIVLWSNASVESRWVREEADRAARRGCLIPVLLEKVDPPFGFGRLEAADLSQWHGDEAAPEYVNLLASVAELVKGGGSGTGRSGKNKAPVPRKRGHRRAFVAAACAAITLAVVVPMIVYNRDRSGGGPEPLPSAPVYPPQNPIPQPSGQLLNVTVRPEPATISPGQKTRIVVWVQDSAGAAVESATVSVSAGAGKFLSPGEWLDPASVLQAPYNAAGSTTQGGWYATEWVCNPCSGDYGMSVEVTKQGYLSAKSDLHVGVIPVIPSGNLPVIPSGNIPVIPSGNVPVIPVQQPLLALTTSVYPMAVFPGQRARISISVQDGTGAAVEGATVSVSAGGGRFLSPGEWFDPASTLQSPYSATGITAQVGWYAVDWVCNPCSGSYLMSVEAIKQGFLGAKSTLVVGIRH